MALGLVDLKAPRIVGGDSQRAVTEMERGLQLARRMYLRLHLAEAYQAVGRTADAREQLNTILSMTPDPNYPPELLVKLREQQLAKISQTSNSLLTKLLRLHLRTFFKIVAFFSLETIKMPSRGCFCRYSPGVTPEES
jgi:hypothetical protein